MKYSVQLLATFALGLVSCNNNELTGLNSEKLKTSTVEEYLVFGEYYGFCPPQNDCARVYKIESGELYIDTIDRMGGARTSITFHPSALPSEKYNTASTLLPSLPEELLTAKQEFFGSPDAYDQGGIVLEVVQNGSVKRFYIDTTVDSLPEFLGPYIIQVKEVLARLK